MWARTVEYDEDEDIPIRYLGISNSEKKRPIPVAFQLPQDFSPDFSNCPCESRRSAASTKLAGFAEQSLWSGLLSPTRSNPLHLSPLNSFGILIYNNLALAIDMANNAGNRGDLVLKVDDNQHTIFHKAILNRHEKIFMLIFELGMMKTLIEICEDKDGNNMLHLAGKMPQEESRVNVVPGAALQLQRELQWFEVVKKVVRPGQIAAKNVDGKTPRDVFMKEHKELREAAEKWMINTANSCMLVATLIATVVFAAAFTVPGEDEVVARLLLSVESGTSSGYK
ncbi:hypothetical protein GH714_006101 [Hevea brasiliensis]|uniref:PGG domain-containing protein n=1 Tax=Hevea brasiliensis TaxID=3981 RepID=A0A6A6MBW8_HEVBR|nr:hypothetical protein GH714_006101 [Hevea brasiliensis]